MTKQELRALAEAALTTKPVTKISAGVTALDLNEREWAKRVREPKATSERECEQRHERGREENGYYKS